MNSAVNIQVWNMNGGPVPDDVVGQLEAAVIAVIKDNEQGRTPIRLLHQTVLAGVDAHA